MRLTIDTDLGVVTEQDGDQVRTVSLYSPEAFGIVNRQWLRIGFAQKYTYTFSWMGRPVIQLPEDMVRIQEIVYRLKPDVILETGIAHGGSLIFYASLCKAMGCGRVIGVDVEIRPHNRAAIDAHELRSYLTLVEGSSVDPDTVAKVKALVRPDEKVLLMLDSNHTRDHVLEELRSYAPLVSVGSYAVAADGIMQTVAGVPNSKPDWEWNNPKVAAAAFLAERSDFVLEEPVLPFDEGQVADRATYWPSAYLRRVA